MRIVKLLPGHLAGFLALLAGALLLSAPAPVEGRPEKYNAAATTALRANPSSPEQVRLQETYGKLPLYFVENRGQVDPRVRFHTEGLGPRIAFTSREVELDLNRGRDQAGPIHLTPVGMKPGVKLQALDPQEARFNYFRGNDRQKWRRDVPSYGAVLYREAYPGVDLKFYGNGQQLEYDLIVHPGADLSRVKFRYRGIAGLRVDSEGNLAVTLPDGGVLVQKKPLVYQEIDGRRVAREGRFRLLQGGGPEYGFQVAAYDKQRPLVIDPVLVYSTYHGYQGVEGIAVDQKGAVYLAGWINAYNYYAFLIKINPAGSALVYYNAFGDWDSVAYDVAVDDAGNAYVAGNGGRADSIPLVPDPPICTYKGGLDAFVTKINPEGNEILYSTFLGGEYDDSANGIAVDREGQAYLTGVTYSDNFILKNPAYPGPRGGADAFVSKINAAGTQLVYSTYLGGSSNDFGYGIAVDAGGHANVSGVTPSSDFAGPAPLRPYGGGADAFVCRLNPGGTELLNFTYLGGAGSDWGTAVALDQSGNIHVAGSTSSLDFPTASALYPNKTGGTTNSDAFVAKISYAWNSLIYSTYLGGGGNDRAESIAVDGAGNAYVAGRTQSSDFPTKDSLQPYPGGAPGPGSYNGSIFVTKLTPSGNTLVYSTFLGGSKEDMNECDHVMTVDRSGNAYVSGRTASEDFPLKNPFEATFYPNYMGFLTKIGTDRIVGSASIDLLLLGN